MPECLYAQLYALEIFQKYLKTIWQNGGEFTHTRKTQRIHPLDILCNRLHITHKTIRPATPWHNGIFMTRGKIAETIKSKYVVLLIIIKHQVESYEDTVFELDF